MAAKFELKAAQGGKFVFNLKATNGQVILSSEIYESKKAAEKGIESVRKNAASEKRFEKREAKNGEQYFVLKAANGEIIGKSEMYKAMRSVDKGIASIQKNAQEARLVDISE